MTAPSSPGEEGRSGSHRLSPALAALAGLVGLGVAFFLSCLFTGTAGAATPPPSLPNALAGSTSAVVAPVVAAVPSVPALTGVTTTVPAIVPAPVTSLATTTLSSVSTEATSAVGMLHAATAPVLPPGGLTVPTLSTLTTSVTGIVPAPSIAPAGITHSMPVTGGGSSTGLATALAPVSFLSDRGSPTTTSTSAAQGSTRPRPSGPGAPVPPARFAGLPGHTQPSSRGQRQLGTDRARDSLRITPPSSARVDPRRSRPPGRAARDVHPPPLGRETRTSWLGPSVEPNGPVAV